MTSLTQVPLTEEWTPSLTEYDSDSYDEDYDEERASQDTVVFQGEEEEKNEPSPKRARRSAMNMLDVEKVYDTDYLAKVNIENYKMVK